MLLDDISPPTGRYLAKHSSSPTTGTCASLSLPSLLSSINKSINKSINITTIILILRNLLTVPPPTKVAPQPVMVGDGFAKSEVRFLQFN